MKKLNLYLTVVFSFLISSITLAQSQTIDYTGDFDYLFKSIKNNSISYRLYCRDAKIDGDSIYQTLRNELKENCTFEKFIEVSECLFNLSGDMHNHFVHSHYFYNYLQMFPSETEKKALIESIDSSYLEQSAQQYKKYFDLRRAKKKPWIRTDYWHGNYYIAYDFEINGVKVPRQSIVREINNVPTSEFYALNVENYFPRFDLATKTFYAKDLLKKIFRHDTVATLKLELPNKKELEISISERNRISTGKIQLIIKQTNHIKYISRSNTLYIKMFSFDFGYQKKIIAYELAKYKNKKIDRVIIDVRENYGGSDLMWIQLLSTLWLNKQPILRPKTCVLKNSQAKNYLGNPEVVDSLENGELLVFDNDITDYIAKGKAIENAEEYEALKEIYADIPQLDFQGKIFCLVDEHSFSAALSFASLQYYYDDFHVVSDAATYYNGFGLTPILFMLPSSKLMYRMAANFDHKLYTTNGRVEPEIKVGLQIDDIIKWKNQRIENHGSKKYMGKKNKYIQAISNFEKK